MWGGVLLKGRGNVHHCLLRPSPSPALCTILISRERVIDARHQCSILDTVIPPWMAGDFRRGLSGPHRWTRLQLCNIPKRWPWEHTENIHSCAVLLRESITHCLNSYAYLHWLWAALVFSQESNSDSNLVGPNSVMRPKLKYYKLISLNSLRVPFLVMERINVSYRCLRASMQGT